MTPLCIIFHVESQESSIRCYPREVYLFVVTSILSRKHATATVKMFAKAKSKKIIVSNISDQE